MNSSESFDSDPFNFKPLKRRRVLSPARKKLKSQKGKNVENRTKKKTDKKQRTKTDPIVNPSMLLRERLNVPEIPNSPLLTSSRVGSPPRQSRVPAAGKKISPIRRTGAEVRGRLVSPVRRFRHDSPAVNTIRQRKFLKKLMLMLS